MFTLVTFFFIKKDPEALSLPVLHCNLFFFIDASSKFKMCLFTLNVYINDWFPRHILSAQLNNINHKVKYIKKT